MSAVGSERSRSPRTFFDANILIYAEDSADLVKQKKAIEAVVHHAQQRTGVVSPQVLGEYFNVVTRKLRLDPGIAKSQAEFFSRMHLVEPTLADVFSAMDLHRLHHIQYWDCLIIQCAEQSGCSVLLSEDMQHGRVINGVRIVNPFL